MSAPSDRPLTIRDAIDADLDDVLAVERAAFGSDVEPDLVQRLLKDPSARPVVSLVAVHGERIVGHVLFTRARLRPVAPVELSLLAPLAVVPDTQRLGVGGALVRAGIERLTRSEVGLVFVLGDPAYYARFGFEPAGRTGLAAPYPIPDVHEDAWRVLALQKGLVGKMSGTVVCAETLDREEYWRE